MKNKKLTAAAMTGMMVLAMGTSVCAASPIDKVGGTDTHNVQAKYVANGKADTVYSVDIAWGNMQYTYTIDSEGTWNPKTHKFENASAKGAWSCGEGADKVKVTNHSNAAVKAAFSYAAGQDYNSITGTFDKAEAGLPTAEGTEVANAPTDTATLSLNGALDKNVATATTIGTATVTLNAAQ